jgi:ppGpp synthetase/RelA/SpoT-type nucleotidyltranferase
MAFPGGSKSRVSSAGQAVSDNTSSDEAIRILDEWRAAHRAVLNTFQAILRSRTRNTNIAVAQRHKRKRTIYDKLQRFQNMQLARMDDVAGCRLIFETLDELYSFRTKLHKARFRHIRKNETDKYDYIKNPKNTGYRGIHDVYSYNVNSPTGKHLEGLLIELQFRTLVQHSWATAVEIIGFITENQPKFERGDDRYLKAMSLASDILARAHENMKGPNDSASDLEVVERFLELDNEINLIRTLKGINSTDKEITQNKNAILIFKETGELEVRTYRDATDALKALFKLEKEIPHTDIVLVKADTSDEVRLAFKNYFSDAHDFIELLESGCQKLSGYKVTNER